MSDLARVHGGRRRRAAGRSTGTDDEWGSTAGRHASDEDATLTPIFQELNRGERRGQRQDSVAPVVPLVSPLDEFRRDPLTAPIPVQALVPVQSVRSVEPPVRRATVGAHAKPEPRAGGRHHRRLTSAGGGGSR